MCREVQVLFSGLKLELM